LLQHYTALVIAGGGGLYPSFCTVELPGDVSVAAETVAGHHDTHAEVEEFAFGH